MIVHVQTLQLLRCDICGDELELTRRTAGSPEVLLLIKSEMRTEHKPCELHPENPERARAERKYCAGMREAFRRAPLQGTIGRPSSLPRRRCR